MVSYRASMQGRLAVLIIIVVIPTVSFAKFVNKWGGHKVTENNKKLLEKLLRKMREFGAKK